MQTEEDGFKIPQGTAHCNQKRLEADERRKIVDRILKRDLDPLDYLIEVVKVRHKLSPYGLTDQEGKAFLLYLVNRDPKKSTLLFVARKLAKELRE